MSEENRPKLFVGSSTEQRKTAYAIQQNLEHDARVTVWDQGVFRVGRGNLENLVNKLEDFDFGVFVLDGDDFIESRDESKIAPRDNVIFELGLFMGHLGRKRAFFVIDREKREFLRIPTDLLGIVPAEFDGGRDDLHAALGPACSLIRNEIEQLGLRGQKESDLKSELEAVTSQRDVYTYVLNRLNPYKDLALTQEFLLALPNDSRFTRIDDVIYPLDSLINNYVPQFIPAHMRVYFAYKLNDPIEVSSAMHSGHDKDYVAHYKIGLSYSKFDEKWQEGLPIGKASNASYVYNAMNISMVRRSAPTTDDEKHGNEPLEGEESLITLPVLYADYEGASSSVGVVGLSSPNPEEATSPKFETLAHELRTLFSALFYSYGSYLSPKLNHADRVDKIREEIANHFEARFRGIYDT